MFKKLKRIKENKELNKVIKELPSNEVICKEILKQLENPTVEVEVVKDEKNKTSLYLVASNKILIGNLEENFIKVQTIAHECVHSIQNRKILLFHYIFSNMYQIIFFFLVVLFLFCKINLIREILLGIFGMMSILHFFLRFLLEKDAMLRAKNVATEYLEKKKIKKETIEKMTKQYEEMNTIGVPLYGTYIFAQNLIKNIILIAIICFIK